MCVWLLNTISFDGVCIGTNDAVDNDDHTGCALNCIHRMITVIAASGGLFHVRRKDR